MAGYIEQVEQWRALVQRQIQFVEDYLGCQVILDENVLAEIVSHTESILAKQCPDFTPNIAKRAGVFVFWFRNAQISVIKLHSLV